MSSMRNAVTRRPHKERSQPTSRQKWGILEKHKDYSLRAADYNAKKAKLSILEQKKNDRHPDEFAFGMVRTQQGKLGRRTEGEGRLSHEAVRLLKTQDAGYLRGVMMRTRREVERVGEEIGVGGVLGRRSGDGAKAKIVFGEDGLPVKRRKLSVENESEDDVLDGDEETATTTTNLKETAVSKPTQKVLSGKQAQKEKDRLAQIKADRKRRKRLQELRANKLEVLKKRQKEILAAADQLDLQRAKMAKIIGGVNKNGVKFKVRERKR